MNNLKPRVDKEVAKMLQQMLGVNQQPKSPLVKKLQERQVVTPQRVADSPMKSVLRQSGGFSGAERTDRSSGIKQRLGIKEVASNRPVRARMELADIAGLKSDMHPGRFICIECGCDVSLQESYRKHGADNLAALFCGHCAHKLNHLGLGLAPIQMKMLDLINTGAGVPQETFGPIPTVAPTSPPTSQSTSLLDRWSAK